MFLEVNNRATLCKKISSENDGIREVGNNKGRDVGAISNQESKGSLAPEWELLTTCLLCALRVRVTIVMLEA